MIERFAGRYALLKHLGQGGMGEVFLARDLATGAECALKRLSTRASLSATDAVRREFEALTRVRHPAVVAVHELGFAPDGTAYYTMEYVPGLASDQALARGDWAALALVASQVARGLEALHEAGVIHGDLKPSNLLVLPGLGPESLPAGVRLLDFGLSALRGREQGGHSGTPGYAAPEVVQGSPPSVASDLYGLGATLYTLVAGRPAFDAADASARLRQQQSGAPSALPLEESGAPAPLVQLILRLMAPEAAERPRDAREARRELERIHPAARRPLAERIEAATVVGRERALARLEQWWLDAARRGRVVVLTGDAGAGKSALLGELAARASLRGRVVLRFWCASLEGPSALGRALLRRLASEAGIDPATLTSGPVREALLGGEREFEEPELGALADAAVGWVGAIALKAGAPLVLLDDTEQLDPRSRLLLRRILLHPMAPPVLWVAARRDDPSLPSEIEEAMRDAGLAEELELAPLDRAGVESLAAARLGQPPPEGLGEFLWSRAAGHAGLTVELLRASAGALRESEAGLVLDRVALERVEIPESFEVSLLRRLAELPAPARAAAAGLAVCEHAADAQLIRAVAPAADEAALEKLRAAGLALRDPRGRYTLLPPALAPCVLETVPEEERRAMHQRALERPGLDARERFRHLRGKGDLAGALEAAEEQFTARPDETLAAEVAAMAEGLSSVSAAAWHERAARALAGRARYAAAAPHLERALELEREGTARPERWTLLATAWLRSGALPAAGKAVAEAFTESPPLAQQSRLLAVEAARLRAVGELEPARTAAERALETAERAVDPGAIGAARLTIASVLLGLHHLDEAEASAVEAVSAYGRARDPVGAIRATVARAAIARARRDPVSAERLYREALAAAREHGNRLAISEVLSNLQQVLVDAGRWAMAREACAEATRLALEDGLLGLAALMVAALAQLDGLTGRPRSARRQARAAVRLTRRHLPRQESLAWRSLAQAHRLAGRLRAAERAARRALGLATAAGAGEELDWCRIEFGRGCAAAGRWKEAGEVWDRALQRPGAREAPSFAFLTALSGRASLRRGDPEGAGRSLEAADQWLLSSRAGPYAHALVDQLRAEIGLSEGRHDEAVSTARGVLASLAALPAPVDRAWAALEFARLVPDRDGDARAPVLEWLELAGRGFERLGDLRGRNRALALTVDWQRRPGAALPARGRDRNLIETVSWLLNSLSDVHALTRRAMQMAVEQLEAERGVLLLVDRETGALQPIAEHGAVDATTRSDAVGFSRRVVQRVTESGGSLLISNAPSDPRVRSDSVVDMRLRSIVCVPMFVGGRVVGAVYLDDSRRTATFSDADRALLEGFAHLMGVAIEKARGHDEVQRANEQLVGENLTLREAVGARFQPENVVGGSSQLQRVMAMVERAARTTTTVLISGESGTGKELIARTIHASSKRRLGPFIPVNCGAIPETLLESELFGILANVATGVRARAGRFAQADGGALFLDEIGEMPLKQQVALLSAIANREVTQVGGARPVPVDVRILAATNRNLRKQVEEGAFREDLYYRLSVIEIEVPPLRDRKADIPPLAHHFVGHFARQQEREVPTLAPGFMAALMQSDWPGNVRELQNYIERVLAMTPGTVLHPNPPPRDLEERSGAVRLGRGRRLVEVVDELARKMLDEALQRAGGNQSLAARELGLTEQTLRYRIRKYGLARSRGNRRIRKNRR